MEREHKAKMDDFNIRSPKPIEYNKGLIETQKTKMIEKSTTIPKEVIKFPVKDISQVKESNNVTIFGKPQTMIDPDLKICVHCKSKIKRIWSTCPICGKNL